MDRLLARLDILVESHYLEVQRILNRCGFLTQPVDLFSALVKLAYLRGKLLALGGKLSYSFISPLLRGVRLFYALCGGGFLALKLLYLTACGGVSVADELQLALGSDDSLLGLDKLRFGGFKLRLGVCDLLGERFVGALPVAELLFESRHGLAQRLDLGHSAQEARARASGSARHGAARIEHLTVEGNYLEAVGKFLCHRYAVVDVVDHRRPAEQGADDAGIFRVKIEQFIRHIDEALAICKPVLGERPRLDGGKRQEGRPARPILF